MQSGKYERAIAATFAEGDWNRDGQFRWDDLLFALELGLFEQSEAQPAAGRRSSKT
jgi:hypothetical protein